jgi:lysophospholipase L1-like esterase
MADERSGRREAGRGTACRALAAVVAGVVATACGGGSSTPTNPAAPTPPVETFSVSGYVFYDVNRNGIADPGDTVRLGDVEIEVGGRTGLSSQTTGQVQVQGVPAGTYVVGVRAPSLPPFFVLELPPTVQVPSSATMPIPMALPIGANIPFNYLCEGDSISQGTGSKDGKGYRTILEPRLEAYYKESVAINYRGGGGGTSADGAARIARDLGLLTPAYVLIGWGTNDWNHCGDPRTCDTVPNLRSIVREVKAANSLPFVATIIPPNVGFDANAPESRDVWVRQENELIKAMAREEGAQVVDLYAAFMRAPSLKALFVDHVHPSPAGHEIIAQTYFDTLTKPRSLSASESFY